MKKGTKKSPYVVSITIGGVHLQGSGASVYEALTAIPKPLKITGKTFVTVRYGEKKSERMLMPVAAKRLFYPLAQRYLAKQFETLLK